MLQTRGDCDLIVKFCLELVFNSLLLWAMFMQPIDQQKSSIQWSPMFIWPIASHNIFYKVTSLLLMLCVCNPLHYFLHMNYVLEVHVTPYYLIIWCNCPIPMMMLYLSLLVQSSNVMNIYCFFQSAIYISPPSYTTIF